MVALALRVGFGGGARSFAIQGLAGTYAVAGAAVTLSSTAGGAKAYALTATGGRYPLSGSGTIFSWVTTTPASAPQAMWPGLVASNALQFSWWPPKDGSNPDDYNVYRADLGDSAPIATGVIPKHYTSPDSVYFASWVDATALPSNTYTYYVRGRVGGVPGLAGPNLTMTTLDATGTTPPDEATDPATYIPIYNPPTGGTDWTATQTSAASNTGTAGTGTGTGGSVGCSLKWAIDHAAPGDTVTLTAGATYTSNNGSAAFTINNPGIWIRSSVESVAYSYVLDVNYVQYTATAMPAAGAQSLTLTKNFMFRTGWYMIVLDTGKPSGIESRQALFTYNSPTIVWTIGLQYAATSTRVLANTTCNCPTPWDAGLPIGAANVVNPTPTMPIIQFTSATGANAGAGVVIAAANVHFTGICVQPVPNALGIGPPYNSANIYACLTIGGAGDGAVVERCVIGRDPCQSNRSYFYRSVVSNGDNVVIRQNYLFGAMAGPQQFDTQSVWVNSNGPYVIENNYMENTGEQHITAGQFVAQPFIPHDGTIRYNWAHKPTDWEQIILPPSTYYATPSFSRNIKNHWEHKTCIRYCWHDNLAQNNAFLAASDGQQGRSFVLSPRDQISATEFVNISSRSWSAANGGTITANTQYATNITIGDKFWTTIKGATNTVYNGSFTCTSTGTNQFTFLLPSTSDPGTMGGTPQYARPSTACGMWQHITDGNIYNNQSYAVGSHIYIACNIDYNPILTMARHRVHNNLTWVNPAMTDVTSSTVFGSKTSSYGLWMAGRAPDTEYSNNTVIMVPGGFGYSNSISHGVTSLQANATANTLCDRWTFTNNIMDSPTGFIIQNSGPTIPPHNNATGGVAVQYSFGSNLTWNMNIFPTDTSSGANAYPATTFNPQAYNTLGMQNFVSNTTMPASPEDYNIVGGQFAAGGTNAGTDGKAVGSYFVVMRYPRLAANLIGGTLDYSSTAVAPTGSWQMMDLAILSFYPGYTAGGKNATQQIQFIRGLAPYITLTSYTKINEIDNSQATAGQAFKPLWDTITANHWFAYTQYGVGTWPANTVPSSFAGATECNSTIYSNVVSGQNYIQYRASFDLTYTPTGPGLLDGTYTDNVFDIPRVDADWNQSGTTDLRTNPTAQQWYRDGFAALMGYRRSAGLFNYRLQWGNIADWGNQGTTLAAMIAATQGYQGLLDGGFMESIIGQSYSYETISWAAMMAYYQFCSQMVRRPEHLIFSQDGSITDYQAMRYGLCSCLLGDAAYVHSNVSNYNKIIVFDEFGFDLGRARVPAFPPVDNGGGSTGMYRRDFEKGIILVNPKGNGSQTMTLETSYKKFTGTQAPGINNGATVTSVTLADRDGLFLQRI